MDHSSVVQGRGHCILVAWRLISWFEQRVCVTYNYRVSGGTRLTPLTVLSGGWYSLAVRWFASLAAVQDDGANAVMRGSHPWKLMSGARKGLPSLPLSATQRGWGLWDSGKTSQSPDPTVTSSICRQVSPSQEGLLWLFLPVWRVWRAEDSGAPVSACSHSGGWTGSPKGFRNTF